MTQNSFVLFRALTSIIFIYAGSNHLLHPEKIGNKVATSKLYELIDSPALFLTSVLLSGIIMIVAGLLLLTGFKQRIAALVLLVNLFVITVTVQLENLHDLGPFFKNVAISGSLLFIINYKTNATKTSGIRNSIAAP